MFYRTMLHRTTCSLFKWLFLLAIHSTTTATQGLDSDPAPSLISSAVGSPDATAATSRITQMLSQLKNQEQGLSAAIEASTGFNRLKLLSRRGDLRIFRGNFSGGLADYSEMIAIDPAQDTPHWRRGIAFYFNRRFKEGASQFERYHAFDARDRENGLWKFLCDVESKDLEYARNNMLPYKQFDRHPFPDLYALYGGDLTLDAYDRAVRPHAESSRIVKFFHLYYRGLHLVHTEKRAGLADIREAVSLFAADEVSESGPGYMWHCARLHVDFIEHQGEARGNVNPSKNRVGD